MKTSVTVLERAHTYDLTTLEIAREELDVPASKLSDKKLKRWISEESDTIARAVKRVLGQEKVIQTFALSAYDQQPLFGHYHYWHGSSSTLGPTTLKLQRYPIREIETVSIDDLDLTEDEWTIDAEAGFLYRVQSPWYGGIIEVVYTGGYAMLGDLPRVYEKACLAQLRHRRSTAGRDPTIRSETVDTFSTTYWVGAVGENAALVPEAMSLLSNEIERSI